MTQCTARVAVLDRQDDLVIVRCAFAPHPGWRPTMHTGWLGEYLHHFDTEPQAQENHTHGSN